mgnify:FL=1
MKKQDDLPQAPRCRTHAQADSFAGAQNEHGLLYGLSFHALQAPAEPLHADSCQFVRCDFSAAQGKSEFLDCIFEGCDFSSADLSGSRFFRCQFLHCRIFKCFRDFGS